MRTAFGRAVAFAQFQVVLVSALYHGAWHGCAAADVEPQRFELHVVFLGAVKQVEDEWAGAHRPGYAFLVHDFDCFASAEFLLQNNAAAQKQRRDKAVVETGGVVQRCEA